MKLMLSYSNLFFTIFFNVLPIISSQTCQKYCGNQLLKYPFGSGPGCGDPRFQKRVTCTEQKLTFTTHTGCYPITDIDYNNQVMYVSDPSMSTCCCTQPSRGFGLDSDAPFSFHGNNNVFALLNCSTTSSPIFKSDNFTNFDLCDPKGAPICNYLYSCRAISMMNVPTSTCCVYTPVDLGPAYEMDLNKLECSSYSGFYGFDGQDSNPDDWKYGIALKYKFNVYNDYPSACADCERSNGVCGHGESYSSFVCNCPNGLNTTSNCFFLASWSDAWRNFPLQISGAWTLAHYLAPSLVWLL